MLSKLSRTLLNNKLCMFSSPLFFISNKFQSDPEIPSVLKASDFLVNRHIGPNASETAEMLKVCGANSLDEFMDSSIPKIIKDPNPMIHNGKELPPPLPESQALEEISKLAQENKLYKTYIGCGYYNTIVPPVIQRNVLENPGWYTAYTPYQSEVS